MRRVLRTLFCAHHMLIHDGIGRGMRCSRCGRLVERLYS
jgi:hypothetical protein